jgi:hypothetical protein
MEKQVEVLRETSGNEESWSTNIKQSRGKPNTINHHSPTIGGQEIPDPMADLDVASI